MAKGLVSDTNLTAIANAIRAKNGSSDTYTPATMAQAISDIPTSQVDQTTALQYMLNNKTDYTGICSGLSNLTVLPEFTPATRSTSLYRAFYGCSSLLNIDGMDGYDKNLTVNNLEQAFLGCSSLSKTPQIIRTNGIVMSGKGAFSGCRNMPSFPMFKDGTAGQPAAKLTNFNNVENMFYNCSSIQTIDAQVTSTGATAAVPYFTSFSQTFRGCSSLTSITLRGSNLGGILSYSSAFWGCTSLTTIQFVENYGTAGYINKDASNTFRGCSALTSIPSNVLDNVVSKDYTTTIQNFAYQSGLTSINLGDRTNKVKNFRDAFDSCPNLVDVGQMDMSSANGSNVIWDMFLDSPNLSNQSLDNIMASLLTITSLYTGTKTLKYIGLSSAQATTCTGLSNWAALSAAGWTTGY